MMINLKKDTILFNLVDAFYEFSSGINGPDSIIRERFNNLRFIALPREAAAESDRKIKDVMKILKKLPNLRDFLG